MISSNQLNLKQTVEKTLERAKGWFLASYPSQKDPSKKIQIIVNYPQDKFENKPESVCIFRGNTCVTLGKSNTYSSQAQKGSAYTLAIHTDSGLNFSINETPLWGRNERGIEHLFDAIQEDSELSQYISFIPQNSPHIPTGAKQKWNLTQLMEKSRS